MNKSHARKVVSEEERAKRIKRLERVRNVLGLAAVVTGTVVLSAKTAQNVAHHTLNNVRFDFQLLNEETGEHVGNILSEPMK